MGIHFDKGTSSGHILKTEEESYGQTLDIYEMSDDKIKRTLSEEDEKEREVSAFQDE
eukprot:CAMPEP_0202974598 /NCGR_PEP_ID=MMETSP1396-20130829/61839_1 /ASSEMBLY_ACC=CAM_ASM_000872 /TAXON_ID= /ORGANISM="Pseudokeronopsis sp., Strain Brazil" /LENGTH=56 /DNA_ID=CAMNT_0049708677 /DNA_START=95 /DNA_END=265 /DNA_ORIENTATION=+